MPFPIPVSWPWHIVARSPVKERTRKVTAFSRTFNHTLATICAEGKVCHICVESTSKCNIKENVLRTLSLELKVHASRLFTLPSLPVRPEAACKKALPIRIFYPRKTRQPSTNPLKPLIFSL